MLIDVWTSTSPPARPSGLIGMTCDSSLQVPWFDSRLGPTDYRKNTEFVFFVMANIVLEVGFEPTKLTHWILSPTPLTTRVSQQLVGHNQMGKVGWGREFPMVLCTQKYFLKNPLAFPLPLDILCGLRKYFLKKRNWTAWGAAQKRAAKARKIIFLCPHTPEPNWSTSAQFFGEGLWCFLDMPSPDGHPGEVAEWLRRQV